MSTFNGVVLPDVAWDGEDPQAGPAFTHGNLWDTMTVDVTALVGAGTSSATVTTMGTDDCLVWVAQVFSLAKEQRSSDLALPFPEGETWYVCQGYKRTISHRSAYAFDLTLDPNGIGPSGCTGSAKISGDRAVTAPGAGQATAVGRDLVCLNLDSGPSLLIGHLKKPFEGRVEADGLLGYTSRPNGHNGHYAHIHVQIHPGGGCSFGTTVPFDDAHGTRFACAPDLPEAGGTNQWSGTALTR